MDDWILKIPPFLWDQPSCRYRFFESRRPLIVLGANQKSQWEVKEDFCQKKQIPILKRKGGGGAVWLGPGTIVLSLGFWDPQSFETQKWAFEINEFWIQLLTSLGYDSVRHAGLGDVTIKNRKILGISLFRKKDLVVYQGSFLFDPNFEDLFQSLQHPSQEPSYRQGRSHEAFLTSLKKEGASQTCSEFLNICQSFFEKKFLTSPKGKRILSQSTLR